MTTALYDEHVATMKLLREWLTADDAPRYTDTQLRRVLAEAVWDADFARTALTMDHVPDWATRALASR